ncbi:MAG: hypothetical protein WAK26_11085, partial [Terracidiphilus sp.]
MKPALVILLLSASFAVAAQAWATTLPDACGDDKIKFDVKTEEGQHTPAPPPAGKALIVFIENDDKEIGCVALCEVTTRVGMDGAWVGA